MMPSIQLSIDTSQGRQSLIVSPDLQSLPLTEILRRLHVTLNTRCGQRGLCEGCTIQLIRGQLTHHTSHAMIEGNGQPVTLRACEYHLKGEEQIHIAIPPRSLLAYEPQVVSEFRVNVPRAHDPIWQNLPMTAADIPAAHHDLDSIAAWVGRHLELPEAPGIDPEVTRSWAGLPASEKSHVTVEYRPGRWLITEVSDSSCAPPLGVAVDIGTTTVALLLVDLMTGKILSSASGFNRQMHLGDDVVTRINLCSTDPTMLGRLQHAIVHDTMERLLLKALESAGASDNQITCISVAANTTMLHLLAGVDPSSLGFSPFTATFLDHRVLSATAIQLRLSSPLSAPGSAQNNDRNSTAVNAPDPAIHLLPSASAYIGADLTAGILSSGLIYDDGPSLLVDVGTNGEIILKHGDKLWACATAAGPAFEGARLACGMRAGQGALSHIRMTAPDKEADVPLHVETDVIGQVKPTGLCGSAYIDFLAQAHRAGVIDSTGRFQTGIADDRIVPFRDYARTFRVAYGHGKEPIVVAESDIASLLQAKAAIAAGILTLLRRIGIAPSQIKTLYLAGGFGMHIDIPNAIACGLFPRFAPQQIQLVGNTSLAGAYLSLLDSGITAEISRIANRIDIVELNLDPEFESCYIDQLQLPEA